MRPLRDFVVWTAVWLVYLVLVHPLLLTPQSVVIVWISGGIASGALIVLPPDRWWSVLVPLAVVTGVGYWSQDLPNWLLIVRATVDVMAILVYAVIVRRNRNRDSGLGADVPWVFLAALLGAAMRVAPVALGAFLLDGVLADYLRPMVAEVGLATVVGLVTGSATVLGLSRWRAAWEASRRDFDLYLGIVVTVAILVLVLLSPFGDAVPGAEFLIVPLLLAAAVRYPVPVTSLLTGTTVFAVSVAATSGGGAFLREWRPDPSAVFSVQMFLLTITVSVFVLASVVAQRGRAQRDAAHSAALMTTVFLESPVPAAWVTLDDGRPASVREANPAFLDLVGLPGDEVRAMRLASLISPVDPDSPLDLSIGRDVRVVGRDGSARWLRPTVSRRFQDPDPEFPDGADESEEFAVLVLEDVTADRISEELLLQQLRRDGLTGLPNRVALVEWMADALDSPAEDGAAGLVVLDIDGLKALNNGMGFSAGDSVIVHLSRRLAGALGPRDLLVRTGGDEFAVFRPQSRGSDTLDALVERLLGCAADPFIIDGRPVSITVSVGSVEAADADAKPSDLLRGADIALQRAKQGGRLQMARFEPGEDRPALERMHLEDVLRDALATDSLLCYYQPIVSISSGRVVGAETLVRLADPDEGVISPDRFLPLAAELGLLGRLTDQVLRQACSAASTWLSAGHDIRVAFNAPPQWLDAAAVERVEAMIDHFGIPTSAITVEVTEEETLSAGRTAIDALASLRSAGIHVAIDDFGTGYAGLDSFRSVPADIVKIDRSFIKEMTNNPEDGELVRSMLELVYRFGKRAVAEGVETAEQFSALGGMGCDYAQGFLLSRPVPFADFPFGLLLPTSPPA